MASVATTTFSAPLLYPSNTKIDRDKSSGFLYVLVHASAANTYEVYRSTNNGGSWSLYLSDVRANITDQGSIFISPDGYLRWVYRTNESSQDRIYIRGLNLNAGSPSWENELLLANPSNGGTGGSYHTGLDVWATITSNQEFYCVAVGTTVGSNSGVTLYGAYTPSRPGLTVAKNSIIRGTRQWLFSGTGRITPSIDAEHSGDAKTASTPNLWVSFGRTGLYVCKLSWQGDGWQGPTTPVTLATGLSARDYVPARWDGAEHLTLDWTGSTGRIYERNRANTATTIRTTSSHPQGTVRAATMSYDKYTRDTRVIAVGTTTNDAYYIDYDRSGDAWSSWTLLTSDDIVGSNVDSFGVRRSTHGNNKFDMITARSTGPQIQHFTHGVSYAPNTPFWSFVGLPYTNGGAASVSASLTLDWVFSDPDDTDTQSAYAVSRQINSGTLNYWRASDSTWQLTEQQNTSGTSLLTLASGWASDGDLVTYKAKTWDQANIPSGYSVALNILASTPVNPTIVTPPDSSTWVEDTVTVTWTVSEQKSYRVELLIFGFLLEDSGWKEVAATRSYHLTTRLENGFNYTVRLTTKNNEGLASTSQTSNITVAFTIPQLPTYVVSPNNTTGNIGVIMTNPARAFINVGTAAHANNASVSPGIPAGLVADTDGTYQQLMVCLAAIRNSGTGTVNLPAGWTDLVNFGNVRVFGRTYVTGDTAPTVTFAGGVAGTDCSAQIAAFRGAIPALYGTAATQLNGVAQDIATPALTVTQQYALILSIGWKQGITTGATAQSGFTEIIDQSTSVGTGQAIEMGYVFQTTPAANVATGTITMGGGTTAISRGIEVAIASAPDVSSIDIYRRIVGQFTNGVRVGTAVAANGTLLDFRAKSGVAYEYRAIAYSATGTSRLGIFTA